MSYMYAILSVVGWTWTAVVAAYLMICLGRERVFSNQHEEQR